MLTLGPHGYHHRLLGGVKRTNDSILLITDEQMWHVCVGVIIYEYVFICITCD